MNVQNMFTLYNIIFTTGSCKCGSKFEAKLESDGVTDVHFNCQMTRGNTNKKCGKGYLRKTERKKVGEELQKENVHVYRARKANELMRQGDPEPPILPNSKTLHVVKNRGLQESYRDPDPVRAITKLQDVFPSTIGHITARPFGVHYWTNHQILVAKKCFAAGTRKISIDATAKICQKINKKHVFLYQIIMNHQAQFSVSQMLSTSQRTDDIQLWLQLWIKSGAPCPREVVCDGSAALMNAAARVFCMNQNIREYARRIIHGHIPPCYIRYDVAHFIQTYARLLKKGSGIKNKTAYIFWMGVIGQLIMCRSAEKAKKMLESIFVVAKSRTEGKLRTGELTSCAKHDAKLRKWMTGKLYFLINCTFFN